MKIPTVLALLASAFVLHALAAAPVNSQLTAVTVYTDRAIITRTGSAELTAGTQEIVFERLPATLVDQSLQVSGRGTAQATILDVSARQTFVDFTPDPRLKSLEDELATLVKQRRALDDRGRLIEAQRGTIEQMALALVAPPAKDVPRVAVADLTSSLTFIGEQRAKIVADQAALDADRETLTPKISAAEAQLNQMRGDKRGRAYKNVNVRVSTANAGRLDVTLSYTVPGASWTPSYDTRVLTVDRVVELGYFGVVRQNTGEDWRDVALTLSTAQPGLGGAPAALTPWTLDVFNPRPVNYAAMRSGMLAAKSVNAPQAEPVALQDFSVTTVGAIGGLAAQERDATVAQAAVESAATSATFRIAAPSTVASDNAPQKISVTTVRLTATPEYLAIPKRMAAAFLTASVVNNSEYPLLAGAMNVFLDGTFVAASQLRAVQAGEKFDLSLGADDGIAIKRKLVNRFAENTGLTNSGRRLTYEFLLTVQNNKKTAERVVLHDQLPLSRNEKIVVKLLAPDSKELKPDTDGVIKWTLDLKPGEKREIALKFSIEHPGDVTVTGIE